MSEAGFEQWLILRGRSLPTIHNHLETLRVILRSTPEWKKEYLDDFIVKLIRKNVRNATINHYIDTIRVYSQYIGGVPELQNYKHIKKQYPIPKATFSLDELERFLNLPCPPNKDKDIWNQDSMFYKLMAFTGMRCSECANIKRENIDFSSETITIIKSKTRPRVIPIPPNIKDELLTFVESLNRDNLFITRTGIIYTDSCWQHSFKKRIDLLNIKRPGLSPYSLRHGLITQLLSSSNAVVIAKLCGNSVQIISENYEHLIVDDMKEVMKKHPIIRKSLSPEEIIDTVQDFIQTIGMSNRDKLDEVISRYGNSLEIKISIKNAPSNLLN